MVGAFLPSPCRAFASILSLLFQEQPAALQSSLDQIASPGWERLDFGANSRGEWKATPTFCICRENRLDVAERKKWVE